MMTASFRRRAVPAGALVVLSLFAGCGDGKIPTYPVRGQVIFKEDGSPAGAGGTIWLELTEPPFHRSGGGIDKEGNFTIGTNTPSDGSMAGKFRVRIDSMSTGGTQVESVRQTIDSKYLTYATSGITAEVIPNTQNVLKIEVEKSKKPAKPAAIDPANEPDRVPDPNS